MAEDIMKTTGIDKYNTEENRSGMRRLYSRHAPESPALSDAAAAYIIHAFAVEGIRQDYGLEECLQGLKRYPDSKELFMLAVCNLMHSRVFYYDEPEGDYPSFTCQPDPESGEMTYLLYSYKRRVPREYRKIYQFHCDGFPEMKDVILASGCKKLALYSVQGTVLDVAEVLACMENMERACASFDHILEEGIAGEDLFEFAVCRLNGQPAACTLKDGTEIEGTLSNMEFVPGYGYLTLAYKPGEMCMVREISNEDWPEELTFKEYEGDEYLVLTDELDEKYAYHPEEDYLDGLYAYADGKLYSREVVYDRAEDSLKETYLSMDLSDCLAGVERITLRTEDIALVRLCAASQEDAE
ncbi:MAG: hypothetical protein LUE27_01495 [Clostridia bacterium]|nr:hypothetical protein [Clostridia bacterium]